MDLCSWKQQSDTDEIRTCELSLAITYIKYRMELLHRNARRIAIWFGLLAVLALTIFAYAPGLHGDFVLDDIPNLLNNQALQVDSFSVKSLWQAAFSSGSGVLRRPVSMLSFALNYSVSGFDPFFFKLTNLVIHILCGLALTLLTRRILESYRKVTDSPISDIATVWIPIIVGAIWLVHPLNLTGVLYIVQRMTSLSALFTICALIMFLAVRMRLYEGRSGSATRLALGVVFAILGLLSKESAALIVAFAVLIEVAIFKARRNDGRFDRCIVISLTLLVALPALLLTAYSLIHPDWILKGYIGRTFTLNERLLTESRALFFYLKSIFAPTISSLGLYHDDFGVSTGLFSPPTTVAALIGLVIVLTSGLLLLRQMPIVGLGILWFFAGHLLESTFIPLELVYEHRNYLPSYGIIFALTYLCYSTTHKLQLGRTFYAIPIFVLLVFSSVTFVRAQQWQDNITHAITEAHNHPKSPRAVYMAGRIYANLYLTGGLKNPAKAYDLLERARTIDNESILPSSALIMLAVKSGQPVKTQWIDTIVRRLQTAPLTPSSVTTLKTLTADRRTIDALGDATVQRILRQALKNYAATGGKRADVLTIYGSYLANNPHDYVAARNMFAESVEIAPRNVRYRMNLAQLLIVVGDIEAAKQSITEAVRLDTLRRHEDEIQNLENEISSAEATS